MPGEAIERLLRACDELALAGRTSLDDDIADVLEAAAAVRAELAPKPTPDGELLPCPFCGCPDVYIMPTHKFDIHVAFCNGGDCGAEIRLPNKAMTLSSWNRRAVARAARGEKP